LVRSICFSFVCFRFLSLGKKKGGLAAHPLSRRQRNFREAFYNTAIRKAQDGDQLDGET
jgi:hypothetical protein